MIESIIRERPNGVAIDVEDDDDEEEEDVDVVMFVVDIDKVENDERR